MSFTSWIPTALYVLGLGGSAIIALVYMYQVRSLPYSVLSSNLGFTHESSSFLSRNDLGLFSQ